MHDPRRKKGLSLAYALSPTGADHMEAPHDPLYAGFHPQGHPLGVLGLIEPLDPLVLDAKKVRAFFETQKVWSAYNSVGMCDFVGTPLNGLELQPMVDYINAVTGRRPTRGRPALSPGPEFRNRPVFSEAEIQSSPGCFAGRSRPSSEHL